MLRMIRFAHFNWCNRNHFFTLWLSRFTVLSAWPEVEPLHPLAQTPNRLPPSTRCWLVPPSLHRRLLYHIQPDNHQTRCPLYCRLSGILRIADSRKCPNFLLLASPYLFFILTIRTAWSRPLSRFLCKFLVENFIFLLLPLHSLSAVFRSVKDRRLRIHRRPLITLRFFLIDEQRPNLQRTYRKNWVKLSHTLNS